MANFEIVLLIGIATWGVVELIKHLAPDAYSRDTAAVRAFYAGKFDAIEERVKELEAKFGLVSAPTPAPAPAAPAPTTTTTGAAQ